MPPSSQTPRTYRVGLGFRIVTFLLDGGMMPRGTSVCRQGSESHTRRCVSRRPTAQSTALMGRSLPWVFVLGRVHSESQFGTSMCRQPKGEEVCVIGEEGPLFERRAAPWDVCFPTPKCCAPTALVLAPEAPCLCLTEARCLGGPPSVAGTVSRAHAGAFLGD
ncbi:hypothetical protein NDU88_002724 [Pleurodeles waltl]|uniref:Uncharacterized protein n=1 Tax=Pleurodeles waltl TaxID=8319 RepID=A0AAV7RBU5_PLEWA|nr:hypothetical protein NDU88_002724 [Pleurodeles waltl]